LTCGWAVARWMAAACARGRLQDEGAVIHVIVERGVPRNEMLRSVGRMEMRVAFGRGDGATHAGSPDRGKSGWRPGSRDQYSPPSRPAPTRET
jgi:error-prone DNA polymerase